MKHEEQLRKAAREYPTPDEQVAFYAGAQWAQEHPEWHKVIEELPKDNKSRIIVYKNDGDDRMQLAVGFYKDGEWRANSTHISGGLEVSVKTTFCDVLYWMDFPILCMED